MFTGKEEHRISVEKAHELTKRYRDSQPADAIKGGFFSRDAFEKILAQKGCVGVRMYFALHEDGKPALVLVGVTPEGDDIDQGILTDDWFPCPPYCGTLDPLNS